MMKIIAPTLIVLVAFLHLGFMILEMFLWKLPVGRAIFKMSLEKAEVTAVLAANQGLYNGLIAAGLLFSLWDPSSRVFFLSCVIVAGVYGAWTVSRTIFWVQAFPAVLGLLALFAAPQ